MFEIQFLGTAASIPTPERNTSATVVRHGGNKFLIDMGEGTQRQLKIAKISWRGLKNIFLTHHHPDHIFGLGGLFFTLVQTPPPSKLTIFGNAKTLEIIRTLAGLVWTDEATRDKIFRLVEIQTGSGILFENRRLTIQAFEVPHGKHRSLGFVFQEKETRCFLTDRAAALGISPGPSYGRLQQGEPVTLASGQIVHPDEVLGRPERGAKFVYVGDCNYNEEMLPYLQDADMLVLEATFIAKDEHLAAEYGHLSARQAATLAKMANAGKLYVNHRSQRYHDAQILEDGLNVFDNFHIARDFETTNVTAGSDDAADATLEQS